MQNLDALISFSDHATVVEGIVRWNSSSKVPAQSYLDKWHEMLLPFNHKASTSARKYEAGACLALYERTTAKVVTFPSGVEIKV